MRSFTKFRYAPTVAHVRRSLQTSIRARYFEEEEFANEHPLRCRAGYHVKEGRVRLSKPTHLKSKWVLCTGSV